MTTNATPGNTLKLKCEISLYQDGHYGVHTIRNGSYLPAKTARVDRDESGRWSCRRWDHGDHLPKPLDKLDVHTDDGEPDWRAIVLDMLNPAPENAPIPETIYPHVVPSGAGFDWQMEQDYRWVKQFKIREEAEKSLEVYLAALDEWMNTKGVTIDYWPIEPGSFGLEDINQGWKRFRQTHPHANPQAMTLGRFEIESLSSWMMGNVPLIPVRPEAYRFKPFEIFGVTVYPVDEPTSFQVLG